MTIKNTIETLSETALDRVAGGIWDRPETDAANQRRAAHNSDGHTFGASLSGNVIPWEGTHGGAIPV